MAERNMSNQHISPHSWEDTCTILFIHMAILPKFEDINWNEIFLFSISRDICSIDFWEYTNCIVALLETLT